MSPSLTVLIFKMGPTKLIFEGCWEGSRSQWAWPAHLRPIAQRGTGLRAQCIKERLAPRKKNMETVCNTLMSYYP